MKEDIEFVLLRKGDRVRLYTGKSFKDGTVTLGAKISRSSCFELGQGVGRDKREDIGSRKVTEIDKEILIEYSDALARVELLQESATMM